MIEHKPTRGRRLNLNENRNNDDGREVVGIQEGPVKKRKEMVKKW